MKNNSKHIFSFVNCATNEKKYCIAKALLFWGLTFKQNLW